MQKNEEKLVGQQLTPKYALHVFVLNLTYRTLYIRYTYIKNLTYTLVVTRVVHSVGQTKATFDNISSQTRAGKLFCLMCKNYEEKIQLSNTYFKM